MSKIIRTIQKIFGGNVGLDGNIAVFGSLNAGDPKYAGAIIASDNPLDDIQSLPGYGQGWTGATVRNNIAPLQDMNALQYLFSSQIAYIMQSGIPEWDAKQDYYKGSFCSYESILYVAINAVTDKTPPKADPNNWRPYAPITSGSTLPDLPVKGHLHYDQTISRWITHDGDDWTTVEGARGDIKHVWAKTPADALKRNPGWRLFDNAMDKGRVLAAARLDDDLKNPTGDKDYKLTEADLPSHSHPFQDAYYAESHNGGGPFMDNLNPNKIGSGKTDWDNKFLIYRNATTSAVGGNRAISRMQPTLYVWILIKGKIIEDLK